MTLERGAFTDGAKFIVGDGISYKKRTALSTAALGNSRRAEERKRPVLISFSSFQREKPRLAPERLLQQQPPCFVFIEFAAQEPLSGRRRENLQRCVDAEEGFDVLFGDLGTPNEPQKGVEMTVMELKRQRTKGGAQLC